MVAKKCFLKDLKFEFLSVYCLILPADLVPRFSPQFHLMTSHEEKHPLPSTNFAHNKENTVTLCSAFHLIRTKIYFRWRVQGWRIASNRSWIASHVCLSEVTADRRRGVRWAVIPQAAQAHVSRKSQRLIVEIVTRCDLVLCYDRNRWKFEHVKKSSMEKEIWSINNDKCYQIWTFYS